MTTPHAGPVTARALPPRPNLEYLKNEAKRRLEAARPTNRRLKLADVQFQLAREYGFASWRELKARIEQDPGAGGPDPVGDWKATFGSGTGVALHIRRADTGRLKATLDVPSQGYFDDPIDSVSFEDQRLTFTITARGVNVLYQADWDAGANQWAGVWTQSGIGTPLAFSRGTLPPVPVVDGLDGLWDGRLTAKEPVRLTFRVVTDERGTLAWLESSRQEGVWHGAVSITREGPEVAIAMRTLSVRGRLSEDGGQIEGEWTRDKTVLPFVLVRRSPGAAAPRVSTPEAIEVAPEALAEFAGVYGPTVGEHVKLGVEDGRLWAFTLSGQRGLELVPFGPDAFFMRQADTTATFERDDAGAVVAMVLHGHSGRDVRAPRVA